MKPESLRIGNYVTRAMKNHIDKKDIKKVLPGDLVSFDDYIFEPIPLTEEWLKDFGFESKNKKIGWYKKEGFLFTLRLQKNNILSVQFISNGLHKVLIEIKYVHSLQNLYFALTGKELTK